jgi:chromosome segregation ATPase
MERSHLKGLEPAAANGLDTARLRPSAAVPAPANSRAEVPRGADPMVDLEKIRDILFGAERRESDRRFAELEQRLEEQAMRAELEIQQRMEAFEEQLKAEVRAMGAELGAAQQHSAERLDRLAEDLRASMARVQRQVEELSAHSAASERDLRQQLAEQGASLGDSLRHNFEELSAVIEEKTRELRAEKVDWAGFGSMLGDLANQVAAKRPR